jgi:hypothetical protein
LTAVEEAVHLAEEEDLQEVRARGLRLRAQATDKS